MLCWFLGARTHPYRRPTSRLPGVQSLIVAAAKLTAVYRARLSTQHRQQDARASPADGEARVVRDIFSRAGATEATNRASPDATLDEKMADVH